ncbi:MAG: hypothetical protein EP297_10840 [Gammaproteobacteria bacterium]|nr:MAG: hypothetical protein EP297_10840 [Gammaproteobacteria bacterium]
MSKAVILESMVTCPGCGYQELATMPTHSCQWFYECKKYGKLLKPKEDDCGVRYSYGAVPYPSI